MGVYAFDLLHLDGFDLSACPVIKRKALLKKIMPKDNTVCIRFTDQISGFGEGLFANLETRDIQKLVPVDAVTKEPQRPIVRHAHAVPVKFSNKLLNGG